MVWVQKPFGSRVTDALKSGYSAYQGGKRAEAARELFASDPDLQGLENFIDPMTGEIAGAGKDIFNYKSLMKRQENQNKALLDRIDYQMGLRRQMRGEERAYQESKEAWKERKSGVRDILENLDNQYGERLLTKNGKVKSRETVLKKEGIGSRLFGVPGNKLSLDLKQRLAERIYGSEPTNLFQTGPSGAGDYGIIEESQFSPYQGQSLLPMY